MALRNAYLQKYADVPSSSAEGSKKGKSKKAKKEKRHKGGNVMIVDNDVVAPSRAREGRARFDDTLVGPSDGAPACTLRALLFLLTVLFVQMRTTWMMPRTW